MKTLRIITVGSLSFTIAIGGALAGTFSLDPFSPTEVGVSGGDELWGPGPAAVPLGVGIPVSPGPPLNVDGISYGHTGVTRAEDIVGVEFSVDRGSTSAFAGSPIGLELGAGDGAAADIWGAPSPPVGAHFGIWDADGAGPGPLGLGGAPALGLIDLPGPTSDEVDGWDSRLPPGPGGGIFFSLDGPSAGVVGFLGADVLFAAVGPGYAGAGGLYAPEAALGLGTFGAGDEVNALVVIEDGTPGFTAGSDAILFSLAPGSPTLGIGPISTADVFIDPASAAALGIPQPFGPGTIGIAAPAFSLDLATTDNLDALDIVIIPEPGAFSLLGLAAAGLLLRRRRI